MSEEIFTEELTDELVTDGFDMESLDEPKKPSKNEGEEQDFIVRFRTLKALRDKYDHPFHNITAYPRWEREKIMEDVLYYYVTNAMRDFSSLLDKIDDQMNYIKHLTEERNDFLARWRKAYKALGWKCSDFHDTAAWADIINKKKEKRGLLPKQEIEVEAPKRVRKKRKAVNTAPAEPTDEQLRQIEKKQKHLGGD